jgi:uncharacterized membrane protein YdjX (TVP38/TMEM64 family)
MFGIALLWAVGVVVTFAVIYLAVRYAVRDGMRDFERGRR